MFSRKLLLMILALYPATAIGKRHVESRQPLTADGARRPLNKPKILSESGGALPSSQIGRTGPVSVRMQVGDSGLFGHPGNPLFQVYGTQADPAAYSNRVSLAQLARFVQSSNGDNKSFIGGNTLYVESRDRDDVTPNSKGVLYPIYVTISPRIRRNNVPYDDANGVSVMNITGIKGAGGTDAFYLGHNSLAFGSKSDGSQEWLTGMTLDANLGLGIQLTGKIDTFAIDLGNANIISKKAVRLGNEQGIYSRANGGDEDVMIEKLNSQNVIEIGRNDRVYPVVIYAGQKPVATISKEGLSLDGNASLSFGSRIALLNDGKAKAVQIGTRDEPIGKGYIASPVFSVRTITAGAVLTLRPSDWMVVIRKLIGSGTTIILPVVDAGSTIVVKDGRGDATKNPITIVPQSGTIDGSKFYKISRDHGWANLTYDGTEWLVH
ncbi:hypothetical protein [Sphingomonas panacis]|uniref:hypothetical protein n=1 Tax=Sphingomonas panacis TaxID=1560345 RepID=UPI00123782F6|nr:hypothetical protein [Sphingomonas panacis]